MTVLPWNLVIRAKKNETLLQTLRRAKIPIRSDCGGFGNCKKCIVKILESSFPQEGKSIYGLKENEVLSCRYLVSCDLKVFVPQSAIERGTVKKKFHSRPLSNLDPSVKRYRLSISQSATLPIKDVHEIILSEIENLYGLKGLKFDPNVLNKKIDFPLRDVEVFVWDEREVIDLRPTGNNGVYGLAVDIGSSVIAAYLLNLEDGSIMASSSILNPQIAYGGDIITRLQYVVKEKERGLKEMRDLLIAGINDLIEEILISASLKNEDILDLVVVGNPVMHHFFLGLDMTPLTFPPFSPTFSGPINLKARDLGLKTGIGAYVHVLPLVGGFVGADTTANMISLTDEMDNVDFMIIDIGTNGEIVVKKGGKFYAASCATGPAFEGVNLSSGMRADIGAIESAEIDSRNLSVKYRVIGNVKPRGICGSGIIDVVSQLYLAGVLNSSGRFSRSVVSERIRNRGGTWEFVVAFAEETMDLRDIVVTQKDIRAIQLGKAAIYAGAKTLLKESGASYDLPIILSGSFGSFLNPVNAYILGMFPSVKVENIIPRGNLAGYGAALSLLDRKKRLMASELVRSVKYLELSKSKDFKSEFFDSLYIPHRKDTFLLEEIRRLNL